MFWCRCDAIVKQLKNNLTPAVTMQFPILARALFPQKRENPVIRLKRPTIHYAVGELQVMPVHDLSAWMCNPVLEQVTSVVAIPSGPPVPRYLLLM